MFPAYTVPLVEKHRISYNLTLKCHVEILTKGQEHDLIGKGHVA